MIERRLSGLNLNLDYLVLDRSGAWVSKFDVSVDPCIKRTVCPPHKTHVEDDARDHRDALFAKKLLFAESFGHLEARVCGTLLGLSGSVILLVPKLSERLR